MGREAFLSAAAHISEHTCIRFVEYTPGTSTINDPSYLEVEGTALQCSVSFVGWPGHIPHTLPGLHHPRIVTVSLGACQNPLFTGSVIHELLHALGFRHE